MVESHNSDHRREPAGGCHVFGRLLVASTTVVRHRRGNRLVEHVRVKRSHVQVLRQRCDISLSAQPYVDGSRVLTV